MKKLIISIIITLIGSVCFADVRNIQDNYQLIYHIINRSGNHIGSETVTLKIKRVGDSYWYDFNDNTFKVSGWTSKTANLTEDSTDEYYYYTYNPPASETAAEQYIMLVDNASATYGDHQSKTVVYQDIGVSDLVVTDNIGINWADVSNPTTALDLSGTNIKTDQQVVVSSFTSAGQTDIQEAMTNQGYTPAVAASITAIEIDTSAMDTSAELRILLTGADVALSTTTAASIWANGTRTLTALDEDDTTIDLDATIVAAVGISGVADAVWDLNISAYTVDGKAGGYLVNASTKAATADNAAIADAVWDEVQSGHTTAGTFGRFLDAAISGVSGTFGTGDTEVDENWGGTDALSYQTSGGIGIDNATVKVFLSSDYNAGNTTDAYIKAQTTTNVNGDWSNHLWLDSGTYTIVFYKQGYYGPDASSITVP